MATATGIQGADYHHGIIYNPWTSLSGGNSTLVISNNFDGVCTTWIKFTIALPCTSITFKWAQGERLYNASGGQMAYKILTSVDSAYISRTGSGGQDGAITTPDYAYRDVTFTITKQLNAGTYYLVLWSIPPGGLDNTFTSSVFFTSSSSGYSALSISYAEVQPVASTITATGNTIGSAINIAINRNLSTLTHTLSWSFAGHSGTIITKTSQANVSWTPNATTFGGYIPNTSSGTMTITCTTYNGNTQVGNATSISFTLNIPSDAAPAIASGWATVGYTNVGTPIAGLNRCIQGYSIATVTFDASKVTLKYGANAVTLTATMGTQSRTGSGNIGTVTAASNAITVTATDSRGKQSSQVLILTAEPYLNPTLTVNRLDRSNSSGTTTDGGAYLAVNVTASPFGNATITRLQIRWSPVGGSYGSYRNIANNQLNIVDALLSSTTSYLVQISTTDSVGGTAEVTVRISGASCFFNGKVGGTGAAFGKYAEADNLLDVAWNERVMGDLTVDGGGNITKAESGYSTNIDREFDATTFHTDNSTAGTFPMGNKSGSGMTLPFRQPHGNTSPDRALQIWSPIGGSAQQSDDLYFRTSDTGAWREYQRVMKDGDFAAGVRGIRSNITVSSSYNVLSAYAYTFGDVAVMFISVNNGTGGFPKSTRLILCTIPASFQGYSWSLMQCQSNRNYQDTSNAVAINVPMFISGRDIYADVQYGQYLDSNNIPILNMWWLGFKNS